MRVPQVGETLGRYRLDRVIGQGGMAVVFAATDTRLDRTVALKVITGAYATDQEFQRRFHAEAAALAKLDSPYVTPIHDHDEVDGILFIATQFVDGPDLATIVRREGALRPERAFALASQIVRGLADAHRKGIVHRDVKPSNVLVRDAGTADEHAYLCDFGVARQPDGEHLTAAGSVTGTWGYLSPECAQGAPASPASDIYALGCVLWSCLTGNPPYGGTDTQIVLAHINNPVPQLPGADPLTQQTNALLARMLAKNPAQRLSDAGEVRTSLDRLAAYAGSSAALPPPPMAGPMTGAPRRRSRLPLLVGAGVLVVALAGGGIAWSQLGGTAEGAKDGRPEKAAAVAGDVDGDGLGDALVLQKEDTLAESGSALWSFASTGRAFKSADRGPVLGQTPYPGDVDGDGKAEMVWVDEVSESTFRFTIGESDGSAHKQELVVKEELGLSRHQMMLSDVTGDRKADLVMVGTPYDGPQSIQVAVSDGKKFAAPAEWWTAAAPSTALGDTFLTGDFDGDGRGDVLRYHDGDHNDDEIQLLVAGKSSFTEGTVDRFADDVYAAYNPIIAPWVVGDVDGDGADELVVIRAGRTSIDVVEVTDKGVGEPRRWRSWKMSGDQALDKFHHGDDRGWALTDVDGDGKEDLLQLTSPKEQKMTLSLRRSNGTSFEEPTEAGILDCRYSCENSYTFVH